MTQKQANDSSSSEESYRSLPVLIVALSDLLAIGLVSSIFKVYEREIGISVATSSNIQAIFSICQLLSAPIIGITCDRYGAKSIFVLCSFLASLSHVLMGISSSHVLYAIARLLLGLTWHSKSVVVACIAEREPRGQRRTTALNTVSTLWTMGMMIGPGLGGALYRYHVATPFVLAAFILTLNAIIILVLLKEEHKPDNTLKPKPASKPTFFTHSFLRHLSHTNATVLGLLAVHFSIQFAINCHKATFPFLAMDRIAADAIILGSLSSFSSLISILYQSIGAPWLAGRATQRIFLVVATIGIACCVAVMPIITSTWHLFCVSVPYSISLAITRVTTLSLLSNYAPDDSVAMTMGLATSAGSLSKVIGQFVGGWVFIKFGVSANPAVAAVFSLLASLAVLFYVPSDNNVLTDETKHS